MTTDRSCLPSSPGDPLKPLSCDRQLLQAGQRECDGLVITATVSWSSCRLNEVSLIAPGVGQGDRGPGQAICGAQRRSVCRDGVHAHSVSPSRLTPLTPCHLLGAQHIWCLAFAERLPHHAARFLTPRMQTHMQSDCSNQYSHVETGMPHLTQRRSACSPGLCSVDPFAPSSGASPGGWMLRTPPFCTGLGFQSPQMGANFLKTGIGEVP